MTKINDVYKPFKAWKESLLLLIIQCKMMDSPGRLELTKSELVTLVAPLTLGLRNRAMDKELRRVSSKSSKSTSIRFATFVAAEPHLRLRLVTRISF